MAAPLVSTLGARLRRARPLAGLVVALTGAAAVLAFVPGAASPAAAAGALTFAVDSTDDAVDATPGDGTCATAAPQRCTLRAAVQEANAHAGADTITLGAVEYPLTIAGSDEDAATTGDLDVTDDVTVTGAGAATVVSGSPAFGDRIFDVLGGTATSAVGFSDLTVRGGLASGDGGGIRAGAGVTLTHVTAIDNTATGYGGGLSAQSATVTAGTFLRNTAAGGGGLYVDTTEGGPGLDASGLTVQDNTAVVNGGGVWARGTLRTSTVSGNVAGFGGGVSVQTSLRIEDTTIADNDATAYGGGIWLEGPFPDDDFVAERVAVTGNHADYDGGGIQTTGCIGVGMVLTNVTVSGNTANRDGGGIGSCAKSPDRLTNVTITDNSPSGLLDYEFDGGGAELVNTIVAGNGTWDCDWRGGLTAYTSLGGNIDGDATCGLGGPGDQPGTDPVLGPLGDHGGPTETHALGLVSPAIDAGTGPGCPATDQRGVARPEDGDSDGTATCDVGAFELEGGFAPVLDPIGGQTVDEGQTRTVTVSAADVDGGPLAFTATGLRPFATLTDNGDGTATLRLAPGLTDAGSSQATVTVTDSTGRSDAETFTVTVNDVAQPPVLAAIGNQTVAEGQVKTVALSATDVDGGALTFSGSLASGLALPPFVTLTGTGAGTATLRLAPGFADAGTYDVKVTVTDPSGRTGTETFTVTVTDVAQPPVLAPIGNVSVAPGLSQTVALSATDVDGGPLTFAATGLPVFATLVDNGDGTATLTVAPGVADTGTSAVTVTVTDATARTDAETFTVTVGALPTISVADASVIEADRDAAGNAGSTPMTFQVALSSGPAATVTVAVATEEGTATAGLDYGAAPSPATLTFAPGGPRQQTVTVDVVGDDLREPAGETFRLVLSNPTNATLARGAATGTILDDILGDLCTWEGGPGDDVHSGGPGADTLCGYGGKDTLSGINGNDAVYGGSGDDTLYGNNGNDRLFGGDGNDSIYAGGDTDTVYGGSGADAIEGGIGTDTIYGEDGPDTIWGDNKAGGILTSRGAEDTIYGGNGNDTINGQDGNDTVSGQAGNDTVSGGRDNDTIYGQDGNDNLAGNFGDDWLYGGAGNDLLNGNEGADHLYGQAGNDTLHGDVGANALDGGPGQDTCSHGPSAETRTNCEPN